MFLRPCTGTPFYQRTKAALMAIRQRLQGVRRGLLFHSLRRWKAVTVCPVAVVA
jgi:hypothetical protein